MDHFILCEEPKLAEIWPSYSVLRFAKTFFHTVYTAYADPNGSSIYEIKMLKKHPGNLLETFALFANLLSLVRLSL